MNNEWKAFKFFFFVVEANEKLNSKLYVYVGVHVHEVFTYTLVYFLGNECNVSCQVEN